MGLFVALIGEYVNPRLGKVLLGPAVLLGLFSVLYWYWSDDLRLYAWVQLLPLLTIPVLMALYRPRYSHHAGVPHARRSLVHRRAGNCH